MTSFKGYEVKPNRESGNGRPDIMVLEIRIRNFAIVIEIEVADEFLKLSEKCDEAIAQIDNKNYETELTNQGYQKVVKFGVAFYEKTCMVKVEK